MLIKFINKKIKKARTNIFNLKEANKIKKIFLKLITLFFINNNNNISIKNLMNMKAGDLITYSVFS